MYETSFLLMCSVYTATLLLGFHLNGDYSTVFVLVGEGLGIEL